MENEKSVFEILSKINCNEFVEKKNGLTYLSWAHAWGLVKSNFPDAKYEVHEYNGKPYLYDEDLGYMVKTSVTINGDTIPMHLPVMDGANKAMKNQIYFYKTKYGEKSVEQASMFDVNKTIMRCLTKNLAMFGLGHYIYAGEDLPESDEEQEKVVPQKKQEQVIIPQSTKEDKPKVYKWMTEKQFEELKQMTKAEIKKYLGIYNGTTPYTDGRIYGMKKQYKEELEKLV